MSDVTPNVQTQRIFAWLSLLMLASVLITASLVLFLGSEEWRANAAFSLIVMSVLVNVAVLFAYAANQETRIIAKISWVAISVASLIFAIYLASSDNPEAQKVASTVLLTAMFVLAFPSGIVATVAVIAYSSQFLAARDAGPFELCIFWLSFVTLGYLQWFRLVPRLVRRIRA